MIGTSASLRELLTTSRLFLRLFTIVEKPVSLFMFGPHCCEVTYDDNNDDNDDDGKRGEEHDRNK